MAKGRWDLSYFFRCILEGLRQEHAKTLNHAKLANIEQEEKEVLGKFLDRLREVLCTPTSFPWPLSPQTLLNTVEL